MPAEVLVPATAAGGSNSVSCMKPLEQCPPVSVKRTGVSWRLGWEMRPRGEQPSCDLVGTSWLL